MQIVANLNIYTKASGEEVQPVRTDKLGRTFANVEDAQTGQYFTLYPKKGDDKALTALNSLSAGQSFKADVTAHLMGDTVKLTARNIKVVKPKK